MKLVRIMLVVMFVLGLAGLAQARELGETVETVVETLTGENSSCPMIISPYVAKTFSDVWGERDLRVELSYECEIDKLTDNNQVMLKAGLEL